MNDHDKGGRFVAGNKAAARRPKKNPNLQGLCKLHTRAGVDAVVTVLNNERAKDADRLRAAELLWAYAWGKPKASVDLSHTYDVTQDFLAALQAINGKMADTPRPAIDVTPTRARRQPKELEHAPARVK